MFKRPTRLHFIYAAILFFCVLFNFTAQAQDSQNFLVVLNFPGPGFIKSDDTLGFRLRTGEERPKHGELRELGSVISKQLTDKLKAEFGNQVKSVGETNCQLPDSELKRLVEKKRFGELGDCLNCRYAVAGKVNFAEFDGHLLTGDKYKVHLSCRLIDCQNNVVLWHLRDHEFDKLMWTKSGDDPLDVFYNKQVPKIVDYLFQHIIQLTGSAKAS